jgi:hypothetical protein
VRGKGSKLGEPCPKVRLSQERMLIRDIKSTEIIPKIIPKNFQENFREYYVGNYFVREKFVAPYFGCLIFIVTFIPLNKASRNTSLFCSISDKEKTI